MIYTELTRKAMVIAYNAHHKQTDKSGVPYIFHPISVAEQMHDEYTTCIALLHDTVEDTSVTLEELSKEFPKEVVDAVALLTHDKSVSYDEYLRKIKTNAMATAVKVADVNHNSSPDRLSLTFMDQQTIDRLTRKYEKAKAILNENEA